MYYPPREYIAWFNWFDNLRWLCTFESILVPHDVSFSRAWDSANAIGSYAANRTLLRKEKLWKS